jgi:hypothetical protein
MEPVHVLMTNEITYSFQEQYISIRTFSYVDLYGVRKIRRLHPVARHPKTVNYPLSRTWTKVRKLEILI